MKLEGSCQCGGVTFTVETSHPVPYQRCYCSICRKIQGGGGYAINLAGDFRTLKVKGEDRITRYHAKMHEPGRRTTRSKAERSVAALPAGAGCDAVIARYRAVVKSDSPFMRRSTAKSAAPKPPVPRDAMRKHAA